MEKLQAVQNFPRRIITNTKMCDCITPILKELGWLPIEQLLLFKDTVMVYKRINKLAPKYLCNKFSKRSQFHDHPMRHQF